MKIRQIIMAAVATLLLCSFTKLPVSKGEFQVDGVSYEVKNRRVGDQIVKTDTVSVCAGSRIAADGKVVIPEKIDFGGTLYTVGRIYLHAFEDRVDLRQIVLPPSVNEVCNSAFRGCVNLESINIPDGVDEIGIRCFRDCKKLRDLTLPASVTKVKGGAFDRCGLRTLTLGEGLKSFNGYDAFMGTDKQMNLDLLTVMASECRLKDVRCKVLDFKGKTMTFATNGLPAKWKCNTQIETLLLPAVDGAFPVWDKGKPQDFAAKCTVYVPDRLVNEFRANPEWRAFKEIKPISSYKGNK